MFTAVIFFSALILLTYLVYPSAVLLIARTRPVIPGTRESETGQQTYGRVFVFMAAHDEEAVIRQTLESLRDAAMPRGKLICFIGSDASTDGTDAVIRTCSEEFAGAPEIRFTSFKERKGKPAIVNSLVETARREFAPDREDLFLMMDANVVLESNFIRELSTAFSDPRTGLADGVLADSGNSGGMAGKESQYLKLETKIKMAESSLWGCAMGPFGGAYMMRPHLYRPVPANFLVDDFFIFYNILIAGYRSRVVGGAVCSEEVSGDVGEEFRRKIRISTGNFQNTAYFLPEMIKVWKIHNLVFWLHKLLRWLSPVFALIALALLALMAAGNPAAGKSLLIIISLLVGIPLLNYLLNQVNLKTNWLQGLSYLIIMNLALLVGFVRYLKGVRTNVWEPTKRTV